MGAEKLTLNAVLDGQSFKEPIEWRSLKIKFTFDNASIQPTINLQKVTFVNEAKDYIVRMFAMSRGGAKRGPYQAMPFQLYISENSVSTKVFDGYIDFKQDFVINSPVSLSCRLVQLDSLDELNKRTKALSFGFLNSLGAFNASDFTEVDTLVRPFDRDMQIYQLAFYDFIISYQAYQLVRDIETDAALLPAPQAFAMLAIDAIFLGLLLVAIAKITKQLFDLLSPTPKVNKGFTFRKGMQKICDKLGYKFNTTIADIDLVYLPSKPDLNNQTTGIPHIEDFGYNCADFIELVLGLFGAKVAVVNGVLELHNVSAPFWQTKSTYIIPPVLHEEIKWNIGDLIANKVYYFETDPMDEYTIKNYSGTNCEVITSELVPGPYRYSLMNGFQKTSFNICLGNGNLQDFDPYSSIRGIIQQFIDLLTGIAGKSARLKDILSKAIDQLNDAVSNLNTTNALVVSGKTWSRPKVLLVKNNRLPSNHRTILCAGEIVKKYHSSNSFLPANPFGQRRLFDKVTVPFQLDNFLELLKCSYANTYSGNKPAKIEQGEWAYDEDTAVLSYWVHDVFTNNIKETLITP